jgi:hypothetical protein
VVAELSLLNGCITWHGRPGRVLWTTFLTGETPMPRDWGGGSLCPGLSCGWPAEEQVFGVQPEALLPGDVV